MPRQEVSQPLRPLNHRTEFGSLAWMEMRLALVHLLWHFDIMSPGNARLWDSEGQMKHMKAWMVWDRPELNVKATVVQRWIRRSA